MLDECASYDAGWLRIRNESALKSWLRQPGRERPRWIEGNLGCASPARGANQERSRRRDRSDALQVGFLFSIPAARTCNHRPSRNMSIITKLPGIRVRTDNPNHHLWNNHGTWFLHYTVHPTPFTKERIRRSLGTKDLTIARERRDSFFAHPASEANKAAAAASARKEAAA